jgi:hypothetical protein
VIEGASVHAKRGFEKPVREQHQRIKKMFGAILLFRPTATPIESHFDKIPESIEHRVGNCLSPEFKTSA